MPVRYPKGTTAAGITIKTRQTTCYHIGDDGDIQAGIDASYTLYTVLSAGQYAGTVNIDMPHYAGATIAFDNGNSKITDSANGLDKLFDGETIVFKGSPANSNIAFTVTTGSVAGETIINPAPTAEVAGAYITICKRAVHSNNCVLLTDSASGKMYSRYGSSAELIGNNGDGKLCAYDATLCYTMHPAAADLQMVAGGTLRIVNGAAEIARYFAGMIIVCSGFANAVNNLPGYRVTAVTVNGADLDLALWSGNQVVAPEAAAGSRDIKIVCQSIYGYAGMANAASLGGYNTNWRIPNDLELKALCEMEAPDGAPDAVAFPGWSTADYFWSSTNVPDAGGVVYPSNVEFAEGTIGANSGDTGYFVALVRG